MEARMKGTDTTAAKPPLCKGRCPSAHTGAEGLTSAVSIPQSPQCGDSPLYTRGPENPLLAELHSHFSNVFRAEAELLQQSRGRAGVTEHIIDADAADGGGQLLAEQAAHGLAQTADDGVLLTGDDPASLFGGGEH